MLGNSNRLNITLALLGSCSVVCANNSEGIEYFETHIRPLFIEHCYECHSAGAKELKANLSLDSRTGWETGGDSGPAIIPGEPEDSLLLHAVSYSNSDLEMPPKNRLPASKIKHLKSWIAMGAPDPRESKVKKTTPQIDLNKGRQFWSFQPPVAYPIPKPRDLAWPNNNIDRFILAQLENQNITPARGASKTALLRRIYFDLIGLPPSPDELRAFLQDKSPQAFQTIVANLLARPEFGERWGRHWLDITRFAESSGGGRSLVFPDAWRFRDYVIDSFNKDKPYHQIVREHLAGDLLPHSSHIQRNSQLIGSGYLVLGALNYELQDHELLKMEFVDEQIDTVGRTFLGMTLGCARCHDHKFDPIPTSDYYALAGIFQSTRSMGKGSAASGVTSFATTPLEITNHAEISRLHSSIGSLKKQIDTLKNSPDLKNFPGLIIDSNEAQLTGNWKKSTASKPWIGKNYLHDENDGKGEKKAQFTTILGETRDYEVLVAYSSGSNRAKNVPVTIQHAEGKTTVIIDQSERPSIWETFTSVGTFPFSKEKPATIIISNEKTTAHVIADAVAFIAPNSVIPQKPKTDLKKLESRHKSLVAKLKKLQPVTMAPTEAETIADGHVHIRGQVRNKGAKVPRGFLTVASQAGISYEIPKGHSGRLELAEWITNPQHPLTSRVMVNRIWKYLLGEGIVRTVDNFGKTGELPSHPKLLDHLAIQFTKNNWSIKSLIREIVLSKTYQLSSKTDDNSDPENRFFGRAHRKRLEAEAIRDTALHLSGQFDPIRGGPTIRNAGQYDLNYDFDSNRRSVYVPWFRNSMLPIFEVFDAPNPNLVVGRRSATNLPTQALFLMNSPFMREQSKLTAKRLLAEAGTIEDTYLLILSRPPSESELLSTQTFLDSFSSDQRTEAWIQLTQALFSTVDFRFID